MKDILFFTTNPDLPGNLITPHIHQSFNVNVINSVKEAVYFIYNKRISMCIIEKNTEGVSFFNTLKLMDEAVPTLLVVNGNNINDKLDAFEMGCTEYIFKPFVARELEMKVDAVIRTDRQDQARAQAGMCFVGASSIDFENRLFKTQQLSTSLSRKEAELLKLLCLNKNKLVTREFILNEIWKSSDYYASKSMDVYLTKVRKIIKEDTSIMIKNVHGAGYMLRELVTVN